MALMLFARDLAVIFIVAAFIYAMCVALAGPPTQDHPLPTPIYRVEEPVQP
jgi:hypothetical protein